MGCSESVCEPEQQLAEIHAGPSTGISFQSGRFGKPLDRGYYHELWFVCPCHRAPPRTEYLRSCHSYRRRSILWISNVANVEFRVLREKLQPRSSEAPCRAP